MYVWGVTPKNKNTGVVVREGEERREKERGLDGRRGRSGGSEEHV